MHAFIHYGVPYLNLAIFLFLIFKFGKKPVTEFLHTRKETFQKEYQEARKLLTEAEAESEAMTQRLANLQNEVSSIQQRASAVTQQEIKKIQDNSVRLAAHFKDEVARIADAEVNQALIDLKKDLVSGVMRQVSQKISTQLDDNLQVKLIETANKKLVDIDDTQFNLADDSDEDVKYTNKKTETSTQKSTGRNS